MFPLSQYLLLWQLCNKVSRGVIQLSKADENGIHAMIWIMLFRNVIWSKLWFLIQLSSSLFVVNVNEDDLESCVLFTVTFLRVHFSTRKILYERQFSKENFIKVSKPRKGGEGVTVHIRFRVSLTYAFVFAMRVEWRHMGEVSGSRWP